MMKPLHANINLPTTKREYKILQITDVHMTQIEDTQTTERISLAEERGRVLFTADGVPAHQRFTALLKYGEEMQADLILLTGDIIDIPSDKNINFLHNAIQSCPIPVFFTPGNHDWSFFDDYHTQNAIDTQLPRFADLCNGDTEFHTLETEDFILVGLDNTQDTFTPYQTDKMKQVFQKGKPVLLAMHVPITSPDLANRSREIWNNQNLCLGPDGFNSEATEEMLSLLFQEDTPVFGSIAGHLHTCWEGEIAPGIPQFVTSEGFDGTCRIINIRKT